MRAKLDDRTVIIKGKADVKGTILVGGEVNLDEIDYKGGNCKRLVAVHS